MGFFPDEIILNILSRLDVKSLVRCRSVCKTWYSINYHSPLFVNTPSFVLVPDSTKGEVDDFLDNGDLFIIQDKESTCHNKQVLKSLKINVPLSDNLSLFLIGYSNGLLCFASEDVDGYPTFICNPITREYLRLPDLNLPDSLKAYGFGFTSTTKEFKIVQIHLLPQGYETQVYTLGSDSWTNVNSEGFDEVISVADDGYGSFLNGSLHWFSSCNGNRIIKLFDLEHENFQAIPIPEPIQGTTWNEVDFDKNLQLAVFGDCLSITDCWHKDRCEIWVMKEYNVKESWNKQFVIRKGPIDSILAWNIFFWSGRKLDMHLVHPVSSGRHGELILLCGGSRLLVSYNLGNGTATLIDGPSWGSRILQMLLNCCLITSIELGNYYIYKYDKLTEPVVSFVRKSMRYIWHDQFPQTEYINYRVFPFVGNLISPTRLAQGSKDTR